MGIKGMKPLRESVANPKLPTAMTHSDRKFVMGKLMLNVDVLHKASQPCLELHNNYINNYMSGQDIIVSYKDCHFLVGDGFFLISFSDLYDLFNLDVLHISNALLHIISPQKLASSIFSIYVLYVSNKFGILRVGTCNNKLFIKQKRSILHILTHK
jgi:hypothetical protein